MPTLLRDIAGFLRFVLKRWRDDRCPQIAGSLTYTTLLALGPMFAVGVAILSSAPFFQDILSRIKIWLLLNMSPDIAGKIITIYMAEFEKNAVRLTWTGIGVVLVLAIWLMLIMDRSFNTIWRVRASRPYWISIVGYAALLVVGPVLLAMSVSFTTYVTSLQISGAGGTVHSAYVHGVSIAISAVGFFLVYRIVPHRPSPWAHALLGGVVAGVLFELAKEALRAYTRMTPTYSVVYGAFTAFPLFLLWLYFSWMVVLFGAELTASAAFWRDGQWKRPSSAAARFREAIAVTQALLEASPAAVSFNRLLEKTGAPPGELEETLTHMIDAGVVRMPTRDGYELTEGTKDVLAAAPQS